MKNKVQDFETSDIYLASTLVALGYTIVNVNKEGEKAVFTFGGSEQLAEDVLNYTKDNLLIQPQKLWSGFKYMKSLLYG